MDLNLSSFISKNTEPILDAWEKYALDIISIHLTPMDARDHARGMLLAIVADMRQQQAPDEQSDKSQGLGPQDETDSAMTDTAVTIQNQLSA